MKTENNENGQTTVIAQNLEEAFKLLASISDDELRKTFDIPKKNRIVRDSISFAKPKKPLSNDE